jgi:hypothetical protein
MQRTLSKLLVVLLGLSCLGWLSSLSMASAGNLEKPTIGWIETAQILPEKFQLSAKIDTGADNSSLHATDPMEFTKGDEKWIRFSIHLEEEDEAITLERPIKRFTRIKNKGAASQKRVVVLLDLCIGTIFKKDVPVSLADRSRFKYPMLIGRSYLKNSAIVDSSVTFSQQPSCFKP